MSMTPAIQTYSGLEFNYANPTADMIDIKDIAWALSNQPRFAGHTRAFYSIAQHSVLVSVLAPEWMAKEALLHDAAEAYMLDIPTPLKQLLPDYQAIYDRVEGAIQAKFGVFVHTAEIKYADRMALATEKRDLMGPADWWAVDVPPAKWHIEPVGPGEAYEGFMQRWEELTDG